MEDEILGANESEVAEQTEETVVETEAEPTSESVESQETDNSQSVDMNAIYADARRKAEREYRDKVQKENDEFVRRFGHLKNPQTGEPIRSKEDYLKALDAQEEMRAKAELKEKGIDPSLLDNLIANNPTVLQAKEVMEQTQRQATFTRINNEIVELSKLDPTITSLDNVPPDIIKMVMDSNGAIDLVNAYKIINYGKVSSQREASITQNAINQAKGKAHLNPVNGVATPDEGVEIPSSELTMWKDMFPNKSNAELKKLYNKTL